MSPFSILVAATLVLLPGTAPAQEKKAETSKPEAVPDRLVRLGAAGRLFAALHQLGLVFTAATQSGQDSKCIREIAVL